VCASSPATTNNFLFGDEDPVAAAKVTSAVRVKRPAMRCERPRKIVEFDLPAGRMLTLQFSGSSDPEVVMAITAITTVRSAESSGAH